MKRRAPALARQAARPAGSRLSKLGPALAVFVLAALAYLPSLRNDFVWDDRNLILENPAVIAPGAARRVFREDFWQHDESNPGSGYYRPLTSLSYAIDFDLHRAQPRGYHATNLVLHAAAAALLFLLLIDVGVGRRAAFLGAALFGTHPALAECVAWISGRTDVLALFFVLLCLLADRRRDGIPWRLASLVALEAALLTKEVAFVTPALALLIAWRLGESFREATRRRLDLLLAAAVTLVVRQAILISVGTDTAPLATGVSWQVRLLAPLHLLGLLLLPGRGRFEYGDPLPASSLLPGAAAGAAILAFLLLVVATRKAKPGVAIADRRALPLLVALGVSGFVPAIVLALWRGGIADRLAYVPAAFLVPAVFLALARVLPASAALAIGSAALVAGTAGSMHACGRWRSERQFYEMAVQQVGASPTMQLNLGIVYHRQGWLAESAAVLETLARRSPGKEGLALLGRIYSDIGCEDLALPSYRRALAIAPGYWSAADDLSSLLVQRGEAEQAIEVLTACLAAPGRHLPELSAKLQRVRAAVASGVMRPQPVAPCGGLEQAHARLRDARFLMDRGRQLLRSQQMYQAQDVLLAVLHLEPRSTSARIGLAQCRLLRHDTAQARVYLQEALQLEPDNATARQFLRELNQGRD